MNAEDLRTMQYFIEDKDDITRWCAWNERKAQALEEIPEIDDWMRSQRTTEALRQQVLQIIDRKSDELSD